MIFSLSGSVTGTIEARAEADLGFRIAGKLIERKVDVGDGVRAGDVLARLDDQDQRNALRTAEADLAAAQAGRCRRATRRHASASFYNGNTTQVLTMPLCCPSARRMPGGGRPGGLQTARDRAGYTELVADRNGVVTSVGPGRGSGRRDRRDGGADRPAGGARGRVHVAEAGVRSAPKDPVIEWLWPARRTYGGPFGRSRPRRSRHSNPYRPDSP